MVLSEKVFGEAVPGVMVHGELGEQQARQSIVLPHQDLPHVSNFSHEFYVVVGRYQNVVFCVISKTHYALETV